MSDSSANPPEFQFGELVEIGGRTMLRPGFSLVGLTGVVWFYSPNAPAGCITVAVNWVGHGYNESTGYPDGSLPLFVNVPVEHLSVASPPEPPPVEKKEKPKDEERTKLRLV